MHTARPEVVGMQPRPRGPLVEAHQLLALLEAPQRRSQGSDVERLGRGVQQMGQDPADLAIEHADQLRAARDLQAQHLLDGQAEGVFLVHRRNVVEPIEIGDVLDVGPRLHQLLGAAMQQADMRIGAVDHLAIHFEHQA